MYPLGKQKLSKIGKRSESYGIRNITILQKFFLCFISSNTLYIRLQLTSRLGHPSIRDALSPDGSRAREYPEPPEVSFNDPHRHEEDVLPAERAQSNEIFHELVAPNLSAADDERAVAHLCHSWLRLDGCIYATVIRVFPDFVLTRSQHVGVVADNVCVYDHV